MFWKKKYDVKLGWEARDGRVEDYTLIIQVKTINKISDRNPYKYYEGKVDSGITYTGVIIENSALNDKSIKVIIPDYEISNIDEGDELKLSIIEGNICIAAERL